MTTGSRASTSLPRTDMADRGTKGTRYARLGSLRVLPEERGRERRPVRRSRIPRPYPLASTPKALLSTTGRWCCAGCVHCTSREFPAPRSTQWWVVRRPSEKAIQR